MVPSSRLMRVSMFPLVILFVNRRSNLDNGYFAMAAQTKPLLHTWSLAVEWQFYIWLPVVAMLVWRAASGSKSRVRILVVALQVFAVASLAWCLWEFHRDAMGSAFFSLRARAWEPLAGGLIAAAEIQRRSDGVPTVSRLTAPGVAVIGWGLVAACIAYPLPHSQWPGALTVLPILGAVMIVAARQTSEGNRVLSLPFVQRLGDWSYSIYLWHWPIWVFASGWLALRGHEVDAQQKILMVLTSLALGAASYHYIEQPFRTRKDFWTFPRLMAGSSAVFFPLLALMTAAILNGGFPSRLPDYLLSAEMARKTNTPRDECFRNSNSIKKAPDDYCSFGSKLAGRPSAILWGDSFANQYLEPISSAAGASGIRGLIATQSGCRAFVDNPVSNAVDQPSCRSFNRSILDFVTGQTEPSIVVLGSRWGSSAEVSDLVGRLLSSGKTVILIMPLLNIGFDVPQRWVENQLRQGGAIGEWKIKADPALVMSRIREEISSKLRRHKDNPRLITVDPQSAICERDYCYLVRDGQANFRDTAHISNVNAMQYNGLFDAAFRSALHAGAEAEEKTE